MQIPLTFPTPFPVLETKNPNSPESVKAMFRALIANGSVPAAFETALLRGDPADSPHFTEGPTPRAYCKTAYVNACLISLTLEQKEP